MSPFSLVLNVLWIVFGGAWMALAWLIAAVIMALTIIGLPWAWAALNIALYSFCRSATRSSTVRRLRPWACSASSAI